MSSNPFTRVSTPTVDRAAILAANPGIKSAAQWFWWIVGLSLINTVLIHSGSDTSFAIGLGFTLLADIAFQSVKALAFVVDAAVLGFFFAMGWFAVRGHRWAFLAGGVVYALDAAIFLYFQDFIALALHAWALFAITTGGLALHRALKAARAEPVIIDLPAAPGVETVGVDTKQEGAP